MPSPATALLLSIAFALVGNMATNTVDPPDSWWWFPWAVWAAVALLVAGSLWVQRRQVRSADIPDDQIVADLAARIERDWSAEAVRREITRPAPLLVSWSSTGRPAASRAAVLGNSADADWQQFPLRGETDVPHRGQPEGINQRIVTAYRRLPRRQLMVLGKPGAGKSVFALLLTIGLIRARRVADEPVPVLLAINTWNPDDSVEAFVASRLAGDYESVLARYGSPQSVAERLVEHQRILPVLDGLDELPSLTAVRAFKALDNYAATGRPLVATCRTQEYEEAVQLGRTILTTTAVVELQSVSVDAAIAYLSFPELVRPRRDPVFAQLRQGPGQVNNPGHAPADVLRKVFSLPLMVALARTAYQVPGTNPAELLGLTGQQQVTGRLMDAFVTAVYTTPAPSGSRPERGYPPERARRWLTYLAYHLYRTGTRDLHWWQIKSNLSVSHPRLARALGVAAAIGIAGWIAGYLGSIAGFDEVNAARLGVYVAIAVSTNWLWPLWPHGYPPYARMAFHTPVRRRIGHGVRLAGYAGFGAIYIGGLTNVEGLAEQTTASVVAGTVFGLVKWLLPAWRPAPPARRTPTTELAHNRRTIGAAAGQEALTAGSIFAASAALMHVPPAMLGLTAAVVYGITAGLVAGGRSWIRFRIAHAFLALKGWLPWRHHTFLDHAHHHGVLRQAGTTYQFRHALLQDHLARAFHSRQRGHATSHSTTDESAALLTEQGRLDELRARADGGDWEAAWRLAALLADQGRVDEAITVLQARADAGDGLGAWHLADLLIERGCVDQAIDILRARADAGDLYATDRLAALLVEHNRVDELRSRADAGDGLAAWRLALVLTDQDRAEEAVSVLRNRASTGHKEAAWRLATLLAQVGHLDRAVAVLRAPADAGDWYAADRLATLLAEHNRLDELRSRASAGSWYAVDQLTAVLARQGHIDEAAGILRARSDAGDWYAARRLAELLAGQRRIDEAVGILLARADAGDSYAAWRSADLLAEQGRIDEATAILQGRSDAGSGYAASQLALLLARQGQPEEAIGVLQARSDAGDTYCSRRLAALLAGQGRIDEAAHILRVRADAGDWYSTLQLDTLLARNDRSDELRARSDEGDREATWRLAARLVERDRVDEAIATLRAHAQ